MTDETIGNVPILILGNKIDRPEAISEERLREMFGLYGQTTGKVSRHSTYVLGLHIPLRQVYKANKNRISHSIVSRSPDQRRDCVDIPCLLWENDTSSQCTEKIFWLCQSRLKFLQAR